jgi:putative hemolysin
MRQKSALNMQPLPPTPSLPWLDAAIVLALVAFNGVFAMSELAIVSSRKPRLQAMVKAGKRGARAALELASDPGRFLSTVQIGITGIGVLSGAYSGEKLGGPLGQIIASYGIERNLAENIGFAIAIILTTYLSLIIGELVPKQYALRNPEPIAALVAAPMNWLSRVTAPLVWLLEGSSAVMFKLFGVKPASADHVTAEELHLIVAEASKSGIIEESERAIISGVVRLADRPVREVMTPRTSVDWINVSSSPEELQAALLATPRTRMPVAEGDVENIIGIVQARDVMTVLMRGDPIDLRAIMRPVSIVPDQVDAMDALEVLRLAEVPMLMVHDEYGHFEGLVTPTDLLAAITGDFQSDQDPGDEPLLVEREDGSLLVSGQMPMDSLAERLSIDLPDDRDYATVAGFALYTMRRLPETGDLFEDQGWRFEIVDMDGRKIDKLLVSEAENQSATSA